MELAPFYRVCMMRQGVENCCCSVTVNLDLFPSADALFDEELGDVSPVVTLQLNDIAPLRIAGCGAIAAPCLLEMARQLSHVEVVGQTTHCRQTLPRIPLLEMQMHEVVATHSFLLLLLLG